MWIGVKAPSLQRATTNLDNSHEQVDSHASRFQINCYFYYLPRENIHKSITSVSFWAWFFSHHFTSPNGPFQVPVPPPRPILPPNNSHPHRSPPSSVSLWPATPLPTSHAHTQVLTENLPQHTLALFGGERRQSLQESVHMWNVKYWNCTITERVWSPTLALFFSMLLMLLSLCTKCLLLCYFSGGWVLQMGLKPWDAWQAAVDKSIISKYSMFIKRTWCGDWKPWAM